MQDEKITLPFLPKWNLKDLEHYITCADDLYPVTEAFLPQERFCARVTQNLNSMSSLYGHDQSLYNAQSQDICLTLLNMLLNTGGNVTLLPDQFQPCREFLKNPLPKNLRHIDAQMIDDCVLITVTDLPLEIFFSYIGYFRHLLAAVSPQREEKWSDYGVTRYDDFDEEYLPTTLVPERFQDSVARGRNGVALQDYILISKEKHKNGLKIKLDGRKITQEKYLELVTQIDQNNTVPDKFDIIKVFDGDSICFGKVEGWAMMLNGKISWNKYNSIYTYMNDLFVDLCGTTLLPAQEYLSRIFRIQYWFIHIMPFYRGSLAAMNMLRYVMTAYYNARALAEERPPIPIVPPRFNYFPDLEALFCCRDENDFMQASLRLIYCVDYSTIN